MRPHTMIAVAAMLLVASAAPASAQQPTLPAGTVIRVTSPEFLGNGPEVGTVVAMGGDTLRYYAREMSHQVVIPLHAISQLEVQSAEKGVSGSRIVTASLLGAAGGAGIGLIARGLSEMSECFLGCEGQDNKAGRWAAVGIGAVAGALVGGMIGSMTGNNKWKRVPLSSVPVGVSVQPRRDGGVGLALTARF